MLPTKGLIVIMKTKQSYIVGTKTNVNIGLLANWNKVNWKTVNSYITKLRGRIYLK